MRTLRFVLSLTLCLLILVLVAYPQLRLIERGADIDPCDPATRSRIYRFNMAWADRLVSTFHALMGVKVRYQFPRPFDERPRPAIVIANHRSTYDALLLHLILGKVGYKEIRAIAKRDVAAIPVIGRAAAATGCAFVTRQKDPKDIVRIRECARGAAADRVPVVIFPEGTTFYNPVPGVSRGRDGYRHVLGPRCGGVRALIEELPDYPILSITIDWGGAEGADSIGSLGTLAGKTLTVRAEFIDGPGTRPVDEWLAAEWARKDALLESCALRA